MLSFRFMATVLLTTLSAAPALAMGITSVQDMANALDPVKVDQRIVQVGRLVRQTANAVNCTRVPLRADAQKESAAPRRRGWPPCPFCALNRPPESRRQSSPPSPHWPRWASPSSTTRPERGAP